MTPVIRRTRAVAAASLLALVALAPARDALAQQRRASPPARTSARSAHGRRAATPRRAAPRDTTPAFVVPPPGQLPLKFAPRPTSAPISPVDLMTRLYVFADDSMLGREAGTIGNVKGTDYIAAEARRLGLRPAGDGGTYFQTIPMVVRAIDPRSSLAIDGGGAPLQVWRDYAPVGGALLEGFANARSLDGVRAIYGGRVGDSLPTVTPEQAAGKLVVLGPARGPDGVPSFEFWNKGGFARFRGAAGIAIATLDISPPGLVRFAQQPQTDLDDRAGPPAPIALVVTHEVAERLVGAPLAIAAVGAVGRALRGEIRSTVTPTPAPARNVVAILPGSDPRLAGEYVAIGAHNDHVGVAGEVVDHDSLRAYDRVLRPLGAESEPGPATPEQDRAARALLDSLRRVHRAPRADSINNGADDDGSGSVSVLEIAEELASRPVKPKRSILFVWHTGEEKGLFGSRYFTDHPAVPRDSIVAQLNIDMIGRGDAADLPNGGPGYVQLIGSRRLSTELGDIVERVNTGSGAGLAFDYQYDANGHPLQYYCRSDHYEYARWGIPIVFFSTGGHVDYHMVTDEPQYIDYAHMARVASFVRDVAVTVADLDHRVAVDKPKPDPYGTCKQ
ncbi:MAG TPA: M28 family peptidase [Gemmatimonadaceae bacterium]|nr:M28 family peptidase [Gemmatimonadaceae bacterium]